MNTISVTSQQPKVSHMSVDELWMQFRKQLRAYISKRVAAEDVDDILSTIMLRVIERQDRLESVKKPLAWLYSITANVITDFYRHRAVEQKAINKIENGYLESLIEPSKHGTESELTQCVLPLINNLAEDYKQALLMVEIDGIKQKDAAENLGLSLSGMKSRVQRGRAKLKAELQRCCQMALNKQALYKTEKANQCRC